MNFFIVFQVVNIFEDPDQGASVIIEEDKNFGSFKISGVLGPSTIIKPVEGEAVKTADCPGCLRLTPHTVMYQHSNESDSSDYQQVEADYSRARRGKSLPGKVHPEILVVVDYQLFKKLKRDTGATQKYIISFFNAVNLRFRTISTPQIELSIAGIVIGSSKSSLPFISGNVEKADMLDAPAALHAMGKYYYKER